MEVLMSIKKWGELAEAEKSKVLDKETSNALPLFKDNAIQSLRALFEAGGYVIDTSNYRVLPYTEKDKQ